MITKFVNVRNDSIKMLEISYLHNKRIEHENKLINIALEIKNILRKWTLWDTTKKENIFVFKRFAISKIVHLALFCQRQH